MTQVVKANMLRIDTASVYVTIKRVFYISNFFYGPNKIVGCIVKLFINGNWWVGVKLV